MTELTANPPSRFVEKWVHRLRHDFVAPGLALDVAAGRGRHTRVLADAGFQAIGIDRNLSALADARHLSQGTHRCWFVCADLTAAALPRGRFQIIVVSRYLDRSGFGGLLESLTPGGSLVYETFTTRQLEYGRGPRSLSHLLAPGELRMLAQQASLSHDIGTDVLFDEEVAAPSALARLVVRRQPHA
jgi:SAM-dependent methyltransferase